MTAADPLHPVSCREALRSALGAPGELPPAVTAHLASCSFCAARQQAALRLATFLRQRPPAPAGLHAEATAERVAERLVEAAEAAPLGVALAKSMPVAEPAPAVGSAAAVGWPEDLLESPLSRATMQPPAPPTAAAWATMRESIWQEVSAGPAPTARPAIRLFGLALAGAAAVAVAAVLVQHPPGVGPGSDPEIVFTDLVAPPAVDFAVLRHGIPGNGR